MLNQPLLLLVLLLPTIGLCTLLLLLATLTVPCNCCSSCTC
jgi:hypothetical protein